VPTISSEGDSWLGIKRNDRHKGSRPRARKRSSSGLDDRDISLRPRRMTPRTELRLLGEGVMESEEEERARRALD